MTSFPEMSGLDGTRVQTQLLAAPSRSFECTQLSLSTMRDSSFVVLTGSDHERPAFTDTEIQLIIDTFDAVVTGNPTAGAAQLRALAHTALAPLWTPGNSVSPSPYDLTVHSASRLIFFLSKENWSFEPARIKLKTSFGGGEFGGLNWLVLNGSSLEPRAFELVDSCTQTGESFEFALFIDVAQAGGSQHTRLIVDPIIKNED
ncbi:hypothetical protein [Maricaulis sp.]|uniref:hypothetical protein n=1 Tax=Maricaulis sp. TaxID=1486257 RepID=UPI003A8CEC6B